VECPWDREQTPQDIVGYTVEEVHELADAIASGDLHAEHGELGDLLLQVVLLALMLNEEGAGDLASVAHDIEVKLIRRHPHIFADAVADTPAEVKSRWERIKVEQEGRVGIFHDVPAGFPALLYAKKLQQRAASVGFDWDSAAEAFPKIAEEHAELAELFAEAAVAEGAAAASAAADPRFADPHRADPRVAHEVGDLLFATVNVARLLHVDPELALRAAGRRFERRVTGAAGLAAAEGVDWSSLELQAQEAYYQRAKADLTAGTAAGEPAPGPGGEPPADAGV
jgi:MazG family protein